MFTELSIAPLVRIVMLFFTYNQIRKDALFRFFGQHAYHVRFIDSLSEPLLCSRCYLDGFIMLLIHACFESLHLRLIVLYIYLCEVD